MRNRLFAVYVVACVAAVIWPGYAWLGNRVEPFVWGLPFSLFWNAAWAVATFVALVLYHATGGRTGR